MYKKADSKDVEKQIYQINQRVDGCEQLRIDITQLKADTAGEYNFLRGEINDTKKVFDEMSESNYKQLEAFQ